MNWINKDTEIYCSFAEKAGNTGCQMMNTAFHYYGLNKIYKSFSVKNIEDAVQAVKTLGIKGFAITMPFKTKVVPWCSDWTDNVTSIGAANTVINENGRLIAHNTDYLAAKTILDEFVGKDLYILGGGGYAAAVHVAARDLGYTPNIINRKNWNTIKEIKDSIIYNCTPVENIEVDKSNEFIDCIVTTETGKRLATIQASHQFKLYTGLEFPLG
mgnify:CR=1 FL=1